MSQAATAAGNIQKDFFCPHCHQDMSNAEMLQTHLQTVHQKQSSTTSKGLFSLVKQKIKGTPSNSKSPDESLKAYAPYFSSNSNDTYSKIGYMRSYDDYFRGVRKSKLSQIETLTRQTLLRLELLTNKNGSITRSSNNAKERQKHEQNVVPWMEDSIASICASCSKSFGVFGRKHHCRLDGRVICNSCSQFISFSLAQWINELNASPFQGIDEVIRLRLNNLLNITSAIVTDDRSNEEHLRICLPCGRFLQRTYDKTRFRNFEKDQLFQHYEQIVQINSKWEDSHTTYLAIVESLLKGEIIYQISDTQRPYQELNQLINKIDSTSKVIANLADSANENDRRYAAVCRNIRAYSIQLIQFYSKATKRAPSKEEIKRICEEQNARLTSTLTEGVKSPNRQSLKAIHFVKQEESVDGEAEVSFIELS